MEIIILCPFCKNIIKISNNRFEGGVNDTGGWILKCNGCSHLFPYPVNNPTDISSINSGASIIESWDDDINNLSLLLKKYGLKSVESYDFQSLAIMDYKSNKIINNHYKYKNFNIYCCPKCKTEVENIIYDELNKKFTNIVNEYKHYWNYYVKGRNGEPIYVVVFLKVKCVCQTDLKCAFYIPFSGKGEYPDTINEFLLADVKGSELDKKIDGLFERDDCKIILEKFLIRWRLLAKVIYIAVPFIGFEQDKCEKRIELWDWLLSNIDNSKTLLITRRATFNSYKNNLKDMGFDLELLKDYDIINDKLKEMMTKEYNFKQDFHTKFYSGIMREVEVLVGSYNIHIGKSKENFSYRKYDLKDFLEKYISELEILPVKIPDKTEVLIVTECGKNFISKIDSFVEGEEFLDKYYNSI